MFNFQRDLKVFIGGTNRVAEVTEIHVESRFEVSAGISPQIEIPYALITLNTSANLFQKMFVQITVSTLSTYRDATRWPGDIEIFRGEVDQVDEVVTPYGMRLVTLRAYGPLKKLMTAKVDSLTFSSAQAPRTRANSAVTLANAQNYSGIQTASLVLQSGTSSGAQMPPQTLNNTTTAAMLQESMDCEAGAIVYAPWETTSTNDVFHWMPRGTFSTWGGATPDPAQTSYFSSNHVSNATHWCVTAMDIAKETSNQYNYISAGLAVDPTIIVNANNYAACKNNTSISYYGVVPLDVTLNYHKLSTNNYQYLQDWVSNLNTTRPSTRVATITAIANLRDGYVNGTLVDPYFLMRMNIPVTVSKTYPGTVNKSFSVVDYYFVSGQIHDITPSAWQVTYELWKGY
jgi:hypothetical protein